MRTSRLEIHKKRRRYKSIIYWLLLIALLAAVIYAFSRTPGVYKNLAAGVMGNGEKNKPASVDTFSQVFDLDEKLFYRIELQSFEDLDSAEKYVNNLKSGKMNAFIVKEDGFKVVYGIFSSAENANDVSGMLSNKKKDNQVAEVKLPGVSAKYQASDKEFIAVVKISDELMTRILDAKSGLSRDYALKSYGEYEARLDEISAYEDKIGQYLEYIKGLQVSENARVFREQYIKLLMDFTAGKTDKNVIKRDYYKLQNGLLLQIKAYRDFTVRLSV